MMVNRLAIKKKLFMNIEYINLASFTSLPSLPSTSYQLEHSAARNRITVKKQRRQQQPIKEKVQKNLFSIIYTVEFHL